MKAMEARLESGINESGQKVWMIVTANNPEPDPNEEGYFEYEDALQNAEDSGFEVKEA